MVEPTVANASEEEKEADAGDAENEQPIEDPEVDMVQTDVGTTGTDPDGFFDGVETDSGGDDAADSLFDGFDDAGGDGDAADEPTEAAETRDTGLAANINRGCARLAVVGLDDEWERNGKTHKKQALQTEFEEVFSAFRLGHYASITVEEYLLIEQDDIHPVWGLVGAMLICAAVVVYRRPDGDQMVDATKVKLGQTDLSKIKQKITKDN